jgi:putative membrane-bound dehydrogenase-like protein
MQHETSVLFAVIKGGPYRHALLLCTLLTLLLPTRGPAADVKVGNQTFTLPDGLTVECVAAPPLVDRPITMAIGDDGALYVADSSGSNDPVEKQLKDKPHRILRLIDTDDDGIYDERTIYADRMMFPAGTLWLDGSLYVAAPPQIWKLTDTTGDGVADQRDIWFDGKTLTFCANDLHGPYAGPDGFIYWTKGANAEQRHTLGNGRAFISQASHLFRMRPDGTDFEPVVTAGMDNPVDVVFAPNGERFLGGTFLYRPANGKRDGIFHAVHGGVWGKDSFVLKGHPRTGALMPVMTELGPAATSGLEMPRLRAWGPDWSGNLFACNFNLRKVSRHILHPEGASFRTVDSDLLVSDQTDFHPTDVIEDERDGGSLLIADTGGWYKICCPTSRLMKPEVLGGIYRVRKAGARKAAAPIIASPATHNPAHLISLLDADTRAVRERTARRLIAMLDNSVPTMTQAIANTERPLGQRLACIWTLTRMSGDAARAAVRQGLAQKHVDLRIAAALSAALHRDAAATESLISLLSDTNPAMRRAAAEALGRIGDRRAIAPLLATAHTDGGRFLEHTLAYALYEIGDRASLVDATNGPGSIAHGMLTAQQDAAPLAPAKPIPTEAAMPGPDADQLAKQRQRLETLLTFTDKGDATRGKRLFNDPRAACITCHAQNGNGATFGPDLTRIGAIRTPSDLMEAIVYPSASFARSYEPMLVKTDKSSALGIIRKDAADEIILSLGPSAEISFPRSDVSAFQPAATSLMPAGYDGTLTPQELADLVAYLHASK